MLEQFKNIFLSNTMRGSTPYNICSCGYESREKLMTKECPNCKNFLTDLTEFLSFDKINFNAKHINVFRLNENDLYRFAIIMSKKSGDYKIAFSKQKISKIKIDKNEVYAIIFDAFEKHDNMIKFYNISEDIYLTAKEFQEKIPYLSEYNYSNRLVEVGAKIDLKYYSSPFSIKTSTFITKLNSLASWCALPYNEILIKIGIDPENVPVDKINTEGTNPVDILGLKKYTIKQLTKNNFTKEKFNCYYSLEQTLGDKIVNYIETFVKRDESMWLSNYYVTKAINLITRANLSIDKLYRYIYKEAMLNQYIYEPSTILSLLSDSFDLTQQLGLPFDKAPKALTRYHDVLVRELNLSKDKQKEQEISEVLKKYKHLQDLSEIDEEGNYISKYSVILPKDSKDIVIEGKLMRHCVGSYINKIASEKSIILFVRHSAFADKPFVTMEYSPETNSIVQIKAFSNTKAPEDIIKYLKKWAKEKNITIRSFY